MMERLDYDPDVEKLENKKDVKGLIRAFKTKETPFVRARIIQALGDIGDKRAVGTLIEAIQYADTGIHGEAQVALTKIGEPAVEPLIQQLKNPYGGTRSRAAETLGKIGDRRAVEPLIQVLETKKLELECIRQASTALGAIGDQSAIEPLVNHVILRDNIGMYSDFGAFALREIGEPAVDYLLEALKHSPWSIRLKLVEALRLIRHKKALEPLLKIALEDVHPEVRSVAVIAIAVIGEEEGLLALQMFYDERNQQAYEETYKRIEESLTREAPLCAYCKFPLPRKIKQGGHHPSCPWNYYIECEHCGYGNNLSYLLGFGGGCSEECKESYLNYSKWESPQPLRKRGRKNRKH